MDVYIDESGDEGTDGRGTRWLVFGCVCVPASYVSSLTSWLGAVSRQLGRGKPRRLHCKEMTHPDRKGVLELMTVPALNYVATVVATDTTKQLPGSWLKHPRYQYNYALRYGLERVSERATELGEQATIYIEQRRNFDLTAFRSYVSRLRAKGVTRLNWNVIDPTRIHTSNRTAHIGLCAADGFAHAAFKALEPDPWWKHFEMSYLEIVKSKLWRGPTGNPNIHLHGFVLMPTSEWGNFVTEYPWIRNL